MVETAAAPFVRTVLGDVPAAELGITYAHEHIIIDPGFATVGDPDFLLDSVELAAQELNQFVVCGGRAMIDSMPCDCGRNVVKLAAVSELSGVHIVAPTGVHLAKYYDPGHWSHSYSEEELAELFIQDIRTGIDTDDYGGPLVRRTGHRAGVIKVASGSEWDERTTRIFRAAVLAHRATGAPVLTHTEQGEHALRQVRLLQDGGVDLSHVVLSHVDRLEDIDTHRDLLETGVNLEYDSAFRWKNRPDNPTLELLKALVSRFPHQLMLGMDAARRTYWKSYGGEPGLTFLLTDFRAQMRASGLSEATMENIFVHNPARAYAFAPVV